MVTSNTTDIILLVVLEMKGQLFLAVCSPAFGTSPDEKSGAFPVNQV